MRTRVTRVEFKRIAADELLTRLRRLGFKEIGTLAFAREQDGFMHGVGLSPDASTMKFTVSVGLLVPALWEKTGDVTGSYAPAFEISHRLGQFRNGLRGLEKWYHFYTVDELRGCFDTMQADLVKEAIPWLDQYKTLADVVAEYYRYRIGPTEGGGKRRPDPFAWATYGWMLDLVGRPVEARSWLTQAQHELANRCRTSVSPALSRRASTRAEVRFSSEEQRLSDVLRASLGP